MEYKRTGSNPVYIETATPRDRMRYIRMARELRLTDQILSFDLDTVALCDTAAAGHAIAWTSPSGDKITINAAQMPKLVTRRNIAVWLGTNAHELFHSLFTPRADAPLMTWVNAANSSTYPGIHMSWNVLEDQRIERLGLARFWAWRGYLTAALAFHLDLSQQGSHLLVAGRTWVGAKARLLARAKFVAENGDALATEAERLIAAYQALPDPGDDDSDEAREIVLAFHEAFGQQRPNTRCTHQAIKEGSPEPDEPPTWLPSDDDDESDDEFDDEFDDDESDDESDDDESEGDESDDESEGDGDGDESEGDESESSVATNGDDGEAGDKSDGESGDDGDSGAKGEAGDGDDADDGDAESDESGDAGSSDRGNPGGVSGDATGEVIDAIDDVIDESLNDEDVADDLDRVLDQVCNGSPGNLADLPDTRGERVAVTPSAVHLANDVSNVLSEIRDDCEASWVRRTDHGRFSVARWATDPDWDADTVFDRFDPAAMDAADMEVALVLDVSGSMVHERQSLAEATWAIRSAVDRIEGRCTTLAFGDDASLWAGADERPEPRLFLPNLESSTNPMPALRAAHHVMEGSSATNKLTIILTDGEWWGSRGDFKDQAESIKATGATLAAIGLGRYASSFIDHNWFGADKVTRIDHAAEMVPFFREIATAMMEAAANR